jgi:pyruvate dehydrogenase E2 component (dihydrolipoyllysine-residue acetyltransferase)
VSAKGETQIVEATAAERALARRVAEARATVPDVELSIEVELDGPERDLTAELVLACAQALREVPRANGSYRDGRFELYSRVNVGVVVCGEGSLLIPTVFDADTKSLAQLSAEISELQAQALAGTLSSPAFSGATFTLANVGAIGVARATPILYPPQAASLTAGAIRQQPVLRDGAIVPGQMITLTLVCDHRILYGAQAARLLRLVGEGLG